jgi:hypothetical protein
VDLKLISSLMIHPIVVKTFLSLQNVTNQMILFKWFHWLRNFIPSIYWTGQTLIMTMDFLIHLFCILMSFIMNSTWIRFIIYFVEFELNEKIISLSRKGCLLIIFNFVNHDPTFHCWIIKFPILFSNFISKRNNLTMKFIDYLNKIIFMIF